MAKKKNKKQKTKQNKRRREKILALTYQQVNLTDLSQPLTHNFSSIQDNQ